MSISPLAQQLVIVAVLQAGLIISPGSDWFLVIRNVARKGSKAGTATAIGLGLGSFLLTVLAIIGLGSLLTAAPILEKAVRYLGGAWLLWQAIITFFPQKISEPVEEKRERVTPFASGVINHLINIDCIFFYTAVISQLSTRQVAVSYQLLIALEMGLFTAGWFILTAYIVHKIPKSTQLLNHIVVRVILGILFAISALGFIRAA